MFGSSVQSTEVDSVKQLLKPKEHSGLLISAAAAQDMLFYIHQIRDVDETDVEDQQETAYECAFTRCKFDTSKTMIA